MGFRVDGVAALGWFEGRIRFAPRFLVGNGGMDPYDGPLRSPYSSPKNPFLHSLLRTIQFLEVEVWGLGT